MAPKSVTIKSPRKLIEVALPLDKINEAAAREKSIRIGHPGTLHLWWAPRPLAAARAVLFAQLVNDPGYERHLNRGVNKVEAAKERERLFKIIEDLVLWKNTKNEKVLSAAREEIRKSWRETCELNRNHPDAATLFDPEKLPAFHDPFAGGGALPLEAQRLGLATYASDLNPVAVMINKAKIDIPARFGDRQPIGPLPSGERDATLLRTDWPGASGLAEDVRRFGAWMRAEAEKRIGHLYPKVEITAEMAMERSDLKPLVGKTLTIVAWLWARTVYSPNPAYSHSAVPLVSTFVLASKPGKEAYVEPVVEGDRYRFTVKVGKIPESAIAGTKLSRGANFKCLLSESAIPSAHIYAEAKSHRMGERLMAIVAEGKGSRVYLSPLQAHEALAASAIPEWRPTLEMPANPRWFSPPLYGLKSYGDLFTARQLVALNTFSDLVLEAASKCREDARFAFAIDDPRRLEDEGAGLLAYSEALAVYLAFGVDRSSDFWSNLCVWANQPKNELVAHLFSRQAIPMTWDFGETNPFSNSGGNFTKNLSYVSDAIALLPAKGFGRVSQWNAALPGNSSSAFIISTDPPYYDNIGYADLSDYFYVWLRRAIGTIYPNEFSTVSVPKAEELIADPYRHGGKAHAEQFFLEGMTRALENLSRDSHPAIPVTLYYAFKQSDTTTTNLTASTGWETFLSAILTSGFSVTGTWPMRTERPTGMKGKTNALASSIVLVCRKRADDAPTISRREFLRELHSVLPDSLIDMTRGGVNSPVQPVDLGQAILGPGMGIFSKYRAVLEADGSPMSIRTALQLINRFLADDEFDPQTQFCLQWFETNYWKHGLYGSADVAARSKGTDVSTLHKDGLLESGSGQVRLLRWIDLDPDWVPQNGNKTSVWQALHQLILALNRRGEQATGALLARMPALSGTVRTLSYRMYTLCERKGLAEDARPYNELIGAWAAIDLAALEVGPIETQADLF